MNGYNLIRPFDPWRKGSLCTCPFKYTINPYTGCEHRCLYCYITSYIKDAFKPRPKKDLLLRAKKDLKKIPKGSIINMSSSSDPYQPLEKEYLYTRKLLEMIKKDYVIEIVTKSNLVVRDVDILSESRSVVSITITTLNERIAKIIEPNAPSPKERLQAIHKLSEHDIPVTLRLDPILPYLTDTEENIRSIVEKTSRAGAKHLVTSIYKAKPDNMKRILSAFPDLTDKYRSLYIEKGQRIHGYWYAPLEYRLRILKLVKEIAHDYGLTFAACREGVPFLHDRGVNCDGTHLALKNVL